MEVRTPLDKRQDGAVHSLVRATPALSRSLFCNLLPLSPFPLPLSPMDLQIPVAEISRALGPSQLVFPANQPLIIPNLKYLYLLASTPEWKPSAMFIQSPQLETCSLDSFDMSWSIFCGGNFSSLKRIDGVKLSDASIGQFLGHLSLKECKLNTIPGHASDIAGGGTFHYSSIHQCLSHRCLAVPSYTSSHSPVALYCGLGCAVVPLSC